MNVLKVALGGSLLKLLLLSTAWAQPVEAQDQPAEALDQPAEPAEDTSGWSEEQPPATPEEGSEEPPSAPREESSFRGVELLDGVRIEGRVVEQKPGAYVIVERVDGRREAAEWSRIRSIDGAPPPPVPAPTAGSLVPPGFTPSDIQQLGRDGQRASEVLTGLFAPKDSTELIGSIQGAQDLAEKLGLKKGPPSLIVISPMIMMPLCFDVTRGTTGRVDGSGAFSGLCRYGIVPISVATLALAPFIGGEVPEMKGPSVHHLSLSVYALDYQKKSALTGTYHREPAGGLGANLGYDAGYTYIHPTLGLLGYGHVTLQQTSIATTRYLQMSSSFIKLDAQAGLDAIRLLTEGKSNYWSQHTAFFRVGPSYFHSWIITRDDGSPGAGAAIDNPLNNSVPLVTGVGYELAAEVEFRLPQVGGYSLGGVHFQIERGTYPSLSFPELNARDGALVALIGFDDLREGSTYTWQRLKLEIEVPLDYSRAGALSLGGQLISYENNFGSGVDNRGLSLDYRWRF